MNQSIYTDLQQHKLRANQNQHSKDDNTLLLGYTMEGQGHVSLTIIYECQHAVDALRFLPQLILLHRQ